MPFTQRLTTYLAGLPRGLTTIVADELGRPLDRHKAQKLLEKIRPAYRGEAFSWHGLRYNAAAELADRTDKEVGAISGHKSRATIRK